MRSFVDTSIQAEIDVLKKSGLYRNLKKIAGPIGTTVSIDGKEVILLSSNNYLGLATHPRLIDAAASVMKRYGTGACASRLIAGNMEIHEELEERIATFKGCQSAILFSTGYMANIGLISSLAREGDLILSDELNHASIIDGCRLSRAEVKVYRHKDVKELRNILMNTDLCVSHSKHKRKFIITDGIFSMDGDITPLPEILNIAKEHDTFVIIDDAHATGVLGKKGMGTVEYFGVRDDRIIHMGTFSKALGSLGGYIAGSKAVIEYLKNKARSFVYSTALPPGVCAASIAAIEMLEKEPWIHEELWKNVGRLKRGLRDLGYDTLGSQTQIIPILIGDTTLTMEFAKAILEKGVYAPGIRPPTVSEGTSRIRTSVMASHTEEQIDKVLNVFKDEGRRLRII
ncbi:MAG: 8-amino-7-oxononanoate synthase [Thermodesulfobacteriota bacterium]|nr:8-amino-7-oxononanoate synthase [Thermodesulfobacteriota bacterium]